MAHLEAVSLPHPARGLTLISLSDITLRVRRKHARTLQAIFAEPTRAAIASKEIEALFLALGAEVSEGSGSRIRVALHGVRAVFHRPHPAKEAHKAMGRSIRRFLKEAGVEPDGA